MPFENATTLASFIEENESNMDSLGVNVNEDLSSRLLKKIEFGSMMKQQFSPVNDPAL